MGTPLIVVNCRSAVFISIPTSLPAMVYFIPVSDRGARLPIGKPLGFLPYSCSAPSIAAKILSRGAGFPACSADIPVGASIGTRVDAWQCRLPGPLRGGLLLAVSFDRGISGFLY